MLGFPHIPHVRKAAEEKMIEYRKYEPLARKLMEQKLPMLLEHSDFGDVGVAVNGMAYSASVNNKKLCGTSGRFNVEVGGIIFTIVVDGNGMIFAQANHDGVTPKWKIL